jgi:hypothetical protein
LASGLERKYAVKQVDRLLTNIQLNVWRLFDDWVPYVVSERTEIVVSIDWTEFEADDHSPLVISLQTNHGRNTQLLWKTHQESLFKGQCNIHERALLTKIRKTWSEGNASQLSLTGIVFIGFFNSILLWPWLHAAGITSLRQYKLPCLFLQLRNASRDIPRCSGQLNPDTWLGRISAFAGDIPSLC